MENRYLAHHGVKGMKWGVRKAKDKVMRRATGLSKQERVRVRAARQKQKAQRARLSLMSDEELNAYYNRLNKEKLTRQLYEEERERGRSTAKKLLSQYGKQFAGAMVGAAATYAGQQFVKKYLAKEE